jgi:hypothetical protein
VTGTVADTRGDAGPSPPLFRAARRRFSGQMPGGTRGLGVVPAKITRFRPACVALYGAASAAASSAFGVAAWSGTDATPIDAVGPAEVAAAHAGEDDVHRLEDVALQDAPAVPDADEEQPPSTTEAPMSPDVATVWRRHR